MYSAKNTRDTATMTTASALSTARGRPSIEMMAMASSPATSVVR